MVKWRVSSTDNLWFYKRAYKPTKTKPISKTLNAVKFGTKYKIYYDSNPDTTFLRPIKIVKTKKEALRFMINFMKKH